MSEAIHACSAHRALVAEAMGPDPSDEALERYALEIPECEGCRKALVVALGVHPAELERASRGAPTEPLAGLVELRRILEDPAPSRRLPLVGIGLVAAAVLAAALALALRPAPEPAPVPAAPVVIDLAPPDPVPPLAPATAPAAPTERLAPRPRAVEPVVAPSPAPSDDAVALADDWPPPPFEDLRGSTPKSVEAPLRSVQLVVSGGAPRAVGDTVGLTVVSSTATSLAVCVAGPERGVVWRGAVPAGRTALSRGGHLQSFAFGAPGTYRFAVGTSDLDRCAEPVHVVEVEVGG